jgi:hypothetical protein
VWEAAAGAQRGATDHSCAYRAVLVGLHHAAHDFALDRRRKALDALPGDKSRV